MVRRSRRSLPLLHRFDDLSVAQPEGDVSEVAHHLIDDGDHFVVPLRREVHRRHDLTIPI
jgi:hypothetical protein